MKTMFEQGEFDDLINLIDSEDAKNIDFKINGLIFKSRMESFLLNWDKGLEFVNQAIDLSRSIENDLFELHSTIAKAYTCSRSQQSILTSAITQIEMIFERLKDSMTDSSKSKIEGDLNFLKGRYYFFSGKRNQALIHLDQSLSIRRSGDNLYDLVEILALSGFSRIEDAENEEMKTKSIEYTKEAVDTANKLNNRYLLAQTYNWYGAAIAYNQNLLESIQIYHKAIELLSEDDDKVKGLLGGVYNNIALAFRDLQDLEQAHKYQEKYISIAEKRGNLDSLAFAYSNMSFIRWLRNEFQNSIDYRKKSLDIAYKMNNKFLVFWNHEQLGFIFFLQGQLNLAERELLLAEKLVSELENDALLARTCLGLSNIYTLKMQTEKAFEKITEGIALLGDTEEYNLRGWLHLNEGLNYRTLNDNVLAQQSFETAGKYWSKLKNTGSLGDILRDSQLLFHKILLMLEIKETTRAEELYVAFDELTANSETDFIRTRSYFLKGIMLKHSTRGSSKFQAQSIFQKIIDDSITDIQIYSLSMLNLCDLLILEMKITENPKEILDDIISIIEKMSSLGKKQNIPNLLVMGEFMQGKIELVQDDLDTARIRFEKAFQIAEEYQINNLISKVSIEQDFVDSQISGWKSETTTDLSLQERVEKAQIHEYLTYAISVKEKMVNSGTQVN